MCTETDGHDQGAPCGSTCANRSPTHRAAAWRDRPTVEELRAATLLIEKHHTAVSRRSDQLLARLREVRDGLASSPDPFHASSLSETFKAAGMALRDCRIELGNFVLAIDKAITTVDLAIIGARPRPTS